MSTLMPPLPDATDPFILEVRKALLRQDATFARSRTAGTTLSGARLLLALSGGPDSTSLLAALRALSRTDSFIVEAMHINHGLRGDESDADQQFCVDLCSAWNVPLGVARLDGTRKDEETLRLSRYRLLTDHARTRHLQSICTGHTLDDQVETVLFRLFRGTSPTGLCGIADCRSDVDTGGLALIRPMLNLRRTAVMEFLERNQLPVRHDSTNADVTYSRNYIRNVIMPAIVDRFPSAVERVEVFRRLLVEDEASLSSLTEQLVKVMRLAAANKRTRMEREDEEFWCRETFEAQSVNQRRRAIAAALVSRQVSPSFEVVERILALSTNSVGTLSLNEHWQVRADSGLLQWSSRPPSEDKILPSDVPSAVALVVPGSTTAPEFGVSVAALSYDRVSTPARFPAANAYEALVDLSDVEGPLFLRSRGTGDVIQPFGMQELVRLKKYLHTHKQDLSQAHVFVKGRVVRTLVLANKDEVLWVPGVGISEKLRVKGTPTHWLQFSLLED